MHSIWNGAMFGDLDWPLKVSRGVSATAELLVWYSTSKSRDLEIWVRGHSRSLKVVLFNKLHMIWSGTHDFLLIFHSNHFETGLWVRQGHWKYHHSIERTPVLCLLTFYSNYGSISCCFWDIWLRRMSWPWNSGQGSLEIIESGNIR